MAVYCDVCCQAGSGNDEKGYTSGGGWLCVAHRGRFRALTREDCVEIFYALESSGPDELVRAIGVDGERLASGDCVPTAEQWQAISDAIESKLERVRSGFYGQDREAREWAQHLSNILAEVVEQ